MTLANLVKVTSATTGTGALTLGAATDGGVSFADAGVQDGQTVSYALKAAGGDREVGVGVYSTSGPTLTRSLVNSSTGSLLNLTGTTEVMVSPLATDFPAPMILAGSGSLIPCRANVPFFAELLNDDHENVLFATPFWLQGEEVDALVVFCVAGFSGEGVGAEVRMGLYGSTASGLPGDLIEEFGPLDMDAAAEGPVVGAFASPMRLFGTYWGVVIFEPGDETAQSLFVEDATGASGIAAPAADFHSSGLYPAGFAVAHTYGALPSSYGAVTTSDAEYTPPFVALRRA